MNSCETVDGWLTDSTAGEGQRTRSVRGSQEINRKSMKINGKSMKINGNQGKSIEIDRNGGKTDRTLGK